MTDENALAKSEMNYSLLVGKAIDKGMDPDSFEKLVKLAWQQEERNNAREFAEKLADFQGVCPPIKKSERVNVVSKRGGNYSFNFAPLDEILEVVRPLLTERGLSISWDTVQVEGRLHVTCRLDHINGHHRTAMFPAPIDGSPAMSSQQKTAGTLTYAQRYALVQVLGLSITDADEDGRDISAETIDQGQLSDLQALMENVNANEGRFLSFFKIKDLKDLPAARYDEAVGMLEQKARGRK